MQCRSLANDIETEIVIMNVIESVSYAINSVSYLKTWEFYVVHDFGYNCVGLLGQGV